MEWFFLVKCFGVGVLSCAGLGPIFILTFNRGATLGFWPGFFTAFGAAIADGLLFSLGLLGVLSFFVKEKAIMIMLDLVGGIILFYLGISAIRNGKRLQRMEVSRTEGLSGMALKAFALTIANPMAMLFYMLLSVQVIQESVRVLSNTSVALGSSMVGFGTLSTLSVVSFLSSAAGGAISEKKLEWLGKATGLLFLVFGTYFIYDFAMRGLHFDGVSR